MQTEMMCLLLDLDTGRFEVQVMERSRWLAVLQLRVEMIVECNWS